tara:strand:+ start:91094 stop:92461 length:1368 start_codon:yes stop_codon:yes gene_type:complete
MFKLITISIFLFFQLQINGKVIEGEGRFYSHDEDGLNFVQKQLLASAYKDVISKELKNMGLDEKAFWESYETKFEEYFTPILNNMKEKYGIDVEGKKADLAGFKKALRYKRLNLKSRYGELYKAISKYSEKSKSRSQQVPNARYIKIRAQVNRRILHKIFLNFTTNNKNRNFLKLYITSNISLKDLSWADMGVEVETDFTSVIKAHWEKWLKDKLNNTVEQIIFTDESDFSSLSNFMKIPRVTVDSLNADTTEETPVNEFSNSLWMKININIDKTYEKDLNQKRGYSISGNYVLIDLNNQELLDHADYSPYDKVYSYRDSKALSSSLATFVYQLPIDNFKNIPESMKNASATKKSINISLNGFDNIKNVFELQKLLNAKGITKQLNAKINFLGSTNSGIEVDFIGSHEDAKNLLKSLTGESIGDNILTFESKENDLLFSLKEKVSESATGQGNKQ